ESQAQAVEAGPQIRGGCRYRDDDAHCGLLSPGCPSGQALQALWRLAELSLLQRLTHALGQALAGRAAPAKPLQPFDDVLADGARHGADRFAREPFPAVEPENCAVAH